MLSNDKTTRSSRVVMSLDELSTRALSDDVSVARPAIQRLAASTDPKAENGLWNVLNQGGYRRLACAAMLERRGHGDIAARLRDREESDEDAADAWVRALVALDDARAVALLARAVEKAADLLSPPWSAVAVGLDALVKLGRERAVRPLARFICEHPGQMRRLASDALNTVGPAAELTWRELLDEGDDVPIEAAWGLFLLGHVSYVIDHLDGPTGDVFAVRMTKLGERGLRVLCGPLVAENYKGWDRWEEMADHIAEHGNEHTALLAELAAGGSELAKLALVCLESENARAGRFRSR